MNSVTDSRTGFLELSSRRWTLFVPVLLYGVLVYPFVFRDVLGEPDLERMALGLVYGAATGAHEAAGFHYNYLVSFGYYAALYHLLPQAVLTSSSSLVAVINTVGFASAVASIGLLGLYTERLFGLAAALVVCIVFGFSPVFLDLGTSGHPQLPGFALLLLGAWLLTYVTDTKLDRRLRAVLGMLCLVAVVAAMCVRADVALAFPFLTLVGSEGGRATRREWLRAGTIRFLILAIACVLWLALELPVYREMRSGESGGYLGSFMATFYHLMLVPRGLVVFVLGMGVATMLVLLVLLLVPAARRLNRLHVIALAWLALPTLLFWLPNSTPARHLLLAYLAVSMLIALALTRWLRASQVIAIAALMPIADQAIAERSHGFLDSHYEWTYPLLTARRATTSIPMGAFPLDHAAKQESFQLLRDEGRSFARACSGRILVISEEPHFMMMSLIERDPALRMQNYAVDGVRVFRASSRFCTADFVEKQAAARRDTVKDFLGVGQYAGWPIYFQESRRNAFDRTAVPADRRASIAAPLANAGAPAL